MFYKVFPKQNPTEPHFRDPISWGFGVLVDPPKNLPPLRTTSMPYFVKCQMHGICMLFSIENILGIGIFKLNFKNNLTFLSEMVHQYWHSQIRAALDLLFHHQMTELGLLSLVSLWPFVVGTLMVNLTSTWNLTTWTTYSHLIIILYLINLVFFLHVYKD